MINHDINECLCRAGTWAIIFVCFVFACGESKSPPRLVQQCEGPRPKEHRDWVMDCIEKGNPMSDEEPEDLIRQCERTAKRMFCEEVVRCEYNLSTRNYDRCPEVGGTTGDGR